MSRNKHDVIETLGEFAKSYLETALWASTDDEGSPLDRDFTVEDFTLSALQKAADDCKAFCDLAGSRLQALTPENAGHNFFLTRNGHGAGFWDLGLGDTGTALTKDAKTFGDCYLYVLNGKVHMS